MLSLSAAGRTAVAIDRRLLRHLRLRLQLRRRRRLLHNVFCL
jgi:hypothetical protein